MFELFDFFDWLDSAFTDPGDMMLVLLGGSSEASKNLGETPSGLIECHVGAEGACCGGSSTAVSVSGGSAAGKDIVKISEVKSLQFLGKENEEVEAAVVALDISSKGVET